MNYVSDFPVPALIRYYPPQHKPIVKPLFNALPVRLGFGIWYPMNILSATMYAREIHIMAKGGRSRALLKKGEYTFVRLSMDAAEKKAAKQYQNTDAAEIDVQVRDMLMSGHKISFSYSETNDNVTCTFTGKPDEAVNEYKMLTSFASSWWQALCTNLYKHNVLFKSGVWENQSNEEDFG
jgi:hypothetical protein